MNTNLGSTPMTTDTFLFNAGWIFFAALSAAIATVNIVAFGPDLLLEKAPLDSAQTRPDSPGDDCE
jgi:hypothetical protein